jgi:hypothetical protein
MAAALLAVVLIPVVLMPEVRDLVAVIGGLRQWKEERCSTRTRTELQCKECSEKNQVLRVVEKEATMTNKALIFFRPRLSAEILVKKATKARARRRKVPSTNSKAIAYVSAYDCSRESEREREKAALGLQLNLTQFIFYHPIDLLLPAFKKCFRAKQHF